MKKHLFFLCVFFSFALLGCGGRQEVKVQSIDSELERKTRSAKMNDILLRSSMAENVDASADYIIGAEDLLEIEVFQAEELKRTVRVSSQGYIGMPLVGQIKAKGLTPVQIEKEIAGRLEKYMEEPLVTVYVKEYKAQKIGVIGAVTIPQVYAVTGQRYLLDMLSMAGGLTKEAGAICYILRPLNGESQGTSKTETIVIDLGELLEKGNIALNVPVFSGDVINIPQGGVFFVDGAVNRPGSFPVRGKTTLMQALALAEGVKFEAEKSNITVFRDNGDGTREVISADYDAIKESAGKDLQIRENDIIIVPKSGVKSFLSGFVNTVRGFASFGTIR